MLSIAGSDSCGGAGIQADLHTFADFNVHGLTAVTAVTAQNLRTVSRIDAIPVDGIVAQLDALVDFPIAAVKIGMLGNKGVIESVGSWLANHPTGPVVLDPVMVATSGASLLADDAIHALSTLCSQVDLVTPNAQEAGILAEYNGVPLLEWAAHPSAVLLKTHEVGPGVVRDVLVRGRQHTTFEHPARSGPGFHGTGCTLSSAIAAHLAHDHDLEAACRLSIRHVQRLIAHTPTTTALQQLLPQGRCHA